MRLLIITLYNHRRLLSWVISHCFIRQFQASKSLSPPGTVTLSSCSNLVAFMSPAVEFYRLFLNFKFAKRTSRSNLLANLGGWLLASA